MKKAISALFCLVLALCVSFSSFAMTSNSQRIYNDLLNGVDVDGYHIDLTQYYLNQAENILNTEDYSDTQTSDILGILDEFRQLCQEQHVHSFDELSKNSTCVNYCISLAKSLGYDVTLTTEGYVVSKAGANTNSNNATYMSVSNKTNPIKATGANYSFNWLYVCIPVCLAIFCVLTFAKVKKEVNF